MSWLLVSDFARFRYWCYPSFPSKFSLHDTMHHKMTMKREYPHAHRIPFVRVRSVDAVTIGLILFIVIFKTGPPGALYIWPRDAIRILKQTMHFPYKNVFCNLPSEKVTFWSNLKYQSKDNHNHTLIDYGKYAGTVWCRYNAVIFPKIPTQNTLKLGLGEGMECLSISLIYILPSSLQWCEQYRLITALSCTFHH